MDEQTVRNAVKVADELVNIAKLPQGEGMRKWELTFHALTDEPISMVRHGMSDIERFLSVMGGPCNAITVKQTDPGFYNQLCEMFGVFSKT